MERKKGLISGTIIAILIAVIVLYFKPLKLAGLENESQYIAISYQEFGITDGSPYIDSTNYNEITEDEKTRILDLLKQYPYKRTFGTIFSNGSMTEMGDRLLMICTYNGSNSLTNTICITDSGKISVNGKNYMLKKSSSLINGLMEIIGK